MNWSVYIVERATKQIKRLPKVDSLRVEETIDLMVSNPFTGDIKKLSGQKNAWRRRVGSYRINLEIITEQKVVYVLEVKRRTSNTY